MKFLVLLILLLLAACQSTPEKTNVLDVSGTVKKPLVSQMCGPDEFVLVASRIECKKS